MPQNTQPTYTYADFGTRFLAYLIDYLILVCIIGVLTAIFFILVVASVLTSNVMGMVTLIIITVLYSAGLPILAVLYFAIFESSTRQATPGKQMMGIIVTDMNGSRITFGRALVRNLCRIISQWILYIGYIMAAFTEKRQALHDILASTLVLKKIN